MELCTRDRLKNLVFFFAVAMVLIVITVIENDDYRTENVVRVHAIPQPLEETEEMFAEKKQQRRLTRLQKVCHQYNTHYRNLLAPFNETKMNVRKIKREHFLKDDAHHLLYCWIHKVASTSWMALFAQITNATGILLTKKFYRMALSHRPQSDLELLEANERNHYFTFMVVRHPFERLLSAYRDRINRSTYSFAAFRHAPKILRLTRPGIDTNKIFRNHSRVLAIVPTFEEFVQYVIRYPMQFFDNHWAPYWRHCSPCSMRYDAVFKLETMTQDAKYFLRKNKLAMKVQLQHLHLTDFGASKEHLRQFYSQISLGLLKALHTKYYLDFQLFGYDIKEYLAYAKNNSDRVLPEDEVIDDDVTNSPD